MEIEGIMTQMLLDLQWSNFNQTHNKGREIDFMISDHQFEDCEICVGENDISDHFFIKATLDIPTEETRN